MTELVIQLLWWSSAAIIGAVVLLKVFGWLSDRGWLPGHEHPPLPPRPSSLASSELLADEPSWLRERRERKPLESMNVPDVFRTTHGKSTHALKNYEAGRNGSEPLQSYCGIETALEDLEGEGAVTCQRCLKSLKLESSKIPRPPRVEPKPIRTAWDRLAEEEDDASV